MLDELERLSWAHVDGTADAESIRRLDHLLRSSAEARMNFLLVSAMQDDLTQVLGAMAPTPLDTSALPSRSHDRTIETYLNRLRRPAIMAIAATVFIVLSAGLILLRHRNSQTIIADPSRPRHVEAAQPEAIQEPAPKTPAATVTSLQGLAQSLGTDGTAATNLVAGSAIQWGQALALGTHAKMRVELDDETSMVLYKQTRLRLAGTPDNKRLLLALGAVDISAAPRAPARSLAIVTQNAEIHAAGAELRVLNDSHTSVVGVRSGRATVTRLADGTSRVVTTNQYMAITPTWCFRPLNATTSTHWRAACIQATGKTYP
ncbi:FecR domain-containing protein [Verrucomicrobiota bacterium]